MWSLSLEQRSGTSLKSLFGIGSYSAAEAARLLETSPRNIRRWMTGYSFSTGGETHSSPPLWEPQLSFPEGKFEIGFRDLIELRFVTAFMAAGLGLKAIRHCLQCAREVVGDDHPFSTRRFRTDGKTIFLESTDRSDHVELLDLKRRQYVIKDVIDRTFRDLDIDHEAVVRWRPLDGRPSIVIDPTRSFGQPIAAESGVPTAVLADAVEAEGSVDRAARLYEVPAPVVRDALRFEQRLRA